MYHNSYYKEKDKEVVLHFMRQHPFAMVIGSHQTIPVATQVPLLIEEKEEGLYLQGHIMKGTDHYKAFSENQNVLCVFTGAQAYVSASWYTTPQTASTWNYISVQAKGTLTFLDEKTLEIILEKTTSLFEKNNESPASFKHLPTGYVQKLIKSIVAFEIKVTSLENVFKLSQDEDEPSYQNIIEELNKGNKDAQGIAAEMTKRKNLIFNK